MIALPEGTYAIGEAAGIHADALSLRARSPCPLWIDRTEMTLADLRALPVAKKVGVSGDGPTLPARNLTFGQAEALRARRSASACRRRSSGRRPRRRRRRIRRGPRCCGQARPRSLHRERLLRRGIVRHARERARVDGHRGDETRNPGRARRVVPGIPRPAGWQASIHFRVAIPATTATSRSGSLREGRTAMRPRAAILLLVLMAGPARSIATARRASSGRSPRARA